MLTFILLGITPAVLRYFSLTVSHNLHGCKLQSNLGPSFISLWDQIFKTDIDSAADRSSARATDFA